MSSIDQIDKNFAVETSLKETDIRFYDVRRDPFEVYGLYNYRTEPQFKRLPDEIGLNVNEGVSKLYLNTAGGRVRFSTDSQYVAIHAKMSSIGRMPHFAFSGSAGFDLFIDEPQSGISRFHRPFMPDLKMTDGYESIIRFKTRELRHFTIHFPTYSNVHALFIGLQQDATLGGGMKYRDLPPVVYYGSSITQGGCTSRPGNIYQNVVSRRLRLDYLDLGFSGSGRAEDLIVDYMAGLPMSAFVSDYDHNAPNAEYLAKTHCKMYQRIREAKPDIPYIMMSRVDFDCGYDENVERRDVIIDTYRYARAQGDRNVYLIDGEGVFRGKYVDMCTVDGVHPNDLGFALMADAVEATLVRAMTQHLFR
jgi:hypothetical protein